jgi:methanogenic corrinoid protein MtbC1
MSPARYYWNIIKLYYAVTMRLRNIVRLLFRHGLRENLKMLAGSTRVTMQYLQKVEKSWSRNET